MRRKTSGWTFQDLLLINKEKHPFLWSVLPFQWFFFSKVKNRQIPESCQSNWQLWNVKDAIIFFSEPVAQRIEALSLYGSRWALSKDSGFNSYPCRPEVYLVKNVVWLATTTEGSNYWGYGYKTQHSSPGSR